MNTYRESFRTTIKRLRKSRNWSQEIAARKIGIKRPTLAAYEEGRSEPPFEILVAICDAYRTKDLYGMLTGEALNMEYKAVPGIQKDLLTIQKSVSNILKTVV